MAAYTTIDNPELFFQCKLYAGNGSSRSITLDGEEDMQPDLVWVKDRSDTYYPTIFDSVRGVNKNLYTNNTAVEGTDSGVSGFNSNGFSLGTNNNENASSDNFVAWCWKAGTAFSNDASATSVGNTDSSGSASSTAGFSISTYTGAGSSLDIVVKHGLSVKPAVMWTRNRDDANSWAVYHHKNTSAPETDYLRLDTTAATTDDAEMWLDTAPTSAVFTAGDHSSSNRSGDNFVSYHWNEVQGFSKFGSYVGTANADGPFIFTGFSPSFVMAKMTSGTANWNTFDNKRTDSSGGNVIDKRIKINDTAAEIDGSANQIDFLANGFKWRGTDDDTNVSSGTFIYMAFAEAPFVNSNGVPANAR